jgi:hypothetical protein
LFVLSIILSPFAASPLLLFSLSSSGFSGFLLFFIPEILLENPFRAQITENQ